MKQFVQESIWMKNRLKQRIPVRKSMGWMRYSSKENTKIVSVEWNQINTFSLVFFLFFYVPLLFVFSIHPGSLVQFPFSFTLFFFFYIIFMLLSFVGTFISVSVRLLQGWFLFSWKWCWSGWSYRTSLKLGVYTNWFDFV